MAKGKIDLKLSKDDPEIGYVALPAHPGIGISNCVARQVELATLVKDYKGIDIYLDFDKSNQLIGIEIVG